MTKLLLGEGGAPVPTMTLSMLIVTSSELLVHSEGNDEDEVDEAGAVEDEAGRDLWVRVRSCSES